MPYDWTEYQNESDILATLLNNNSVYTKYNLQENLRPEMFNNKTYQQVYKHIQQEIKRYKIVDIHTIRNLHKDIVDNLANTQPVQLDLFERKVGYLIEDYNYNVIQQKISNTLKVLDKENAIHQMNTLIHDLDKLPKQICDLVKRKTHYSLDEVIQSKIEQEKDPDCDHLKTNYKELDDITGGFKGGELIILGARTSVGKTSLAINLATRIAQQRKKVLFISLEMTAEQIGYKIISGMTQIPTTQLIRKKPTPNQKHILEQLKQSPLPIIIDDSCNATVEDVHRIIKNERNLYFVVVDYVQLVSPETKGFSKVHELTLITNRIKQIAKEFNIPILCLSQLSRGLESRDEKDKTPKLHDLKDSGSIEQDADVVLLLHKHSPIQAELVVAKNRTGRLGKIMLQFDQETTSFY